jgi:hypothetical protein
MVKFLIKEEKLRDTEQVEMTDYCHQLARDGEPGMAPRLLL